MILRYHVTAKYIPTSGIMRTHERGLGSLFHLDKTEQMRERAMEIARKHPYTTVSICAPRGEERVARVYLQTVCGTNVLHQSYSKRLDEPL